MKNYIKYLIAGAVTIIIIIFVVLLGNFNTVYDKLTIVENEASAVKSLNTSIPKQIIIHTDFYRKTIITSKLEIDHILDLINTIKNSSSNKHEVVESNNSSYTVDGEIFYNNNKVDKFSLNNKLTFDGHTYNANSYLINMLHRVLFNYFNTYEHLIDILNTNKSSIYCIDKDKKFYLNKKQKLNLAKELSKLIPMNDRVKLNKTNINDKKLYTLKIKINKDLENKTNNLVFIDVYKNYIVIQFLADDNGKKIYMEGAINEFKN